MKLMTNMEHGTLVHSDWIDSFDDLQKEQIILGDLADLDVTIYGKPCYDAHQMSEIRYGLLSHVNVDLRKPFLSFGSNANDSKGS